MAPNYTSPVTCQADLQIASLGEVCSASAFVVFMTLLESLIRSNETVSGLCERVQPVEVPNDEYDFVVIGGGGAGAVVASRLSEIPNWRVLVLEAGPDEPARGGVPMLFATLLGSALDWNHTTTNESHACLSSNGSCRIATGKLLGGSTSHNGMVYLRGVPTDYDNWAASGNEGWSWEEVEPYFIKGEDNGEIERVGTSHHGTGGRLSVERFPYIPPFGFSVLDAAREAGYTVTEDLNGDDLTGFSYTQATSKNGVRRSSAAAYLRPVRNRANLHVSLDSFASRVITENGTAVGVEYYKNDELKMVKVTQEVVVSAGAIGSPKLLLLSGIGPKEHLESVGVEVIEDLSGVGENYHDHVMFIVDYTINDNDTYEYDSAVATEYLNFQTGPMAGAGLLSIVGILATNYTSADYPDIQLSLGGYRSRCAPGEINAPRSTGRRTVSMNTVNLHPQSRGKISLASTDVFESPVIWGNYLGESIDVDRLIEGMELTMALAETETMRAWNLTLSSTPVEACFNYTFPSTEYWTCAMHQRAASVLHPAGTCKMGPKSDSMAVVDHRLRVHGIKGLRVADTSIMPQVTSGNTAAPAMMIGERVADFIKQDLLGSLKFTEAAHHLSQAEHALYFHDINKLFKHYNMYRDFNYLSFNPWRKETFINRQRSIRFSFYAKDCSLL